MAIIQFGTGGASFNPSAINAALLANPTPLTPALIQETSIDFKAGNKKLYGRNQWAVDVARGQIDATGKGKIGSTDPIFLNQVYFGMPVTSGSTVRQVINESHAPGATVTIAPPTGTFNENLGVINGTTGDPFIMIPSGTPAIGQYSVNASTGVYTFASGETATSVQISYKYNDPTSGSTIVISSQVNGYSPEFELNLFNTYRSRTFGLQMFRCKMTDMSLATKQNDYWMADFSFDICANDAGLVGSLYTT